MKAGANRAYKYVSVRKRVCDYESALQGKYRPQPQVLHMGSFAQPKEYVGKPYRSQCAPETRAFARKNRYTSFRAEVPQYEQTGQRSMARLNADDGGGVSYFDGWSLSRCLALSLFVVILLCFVRGPQTVVTTYNVLPLTFNDSPAGLFLWIITLWLLTTFWNSVKGTLCGTTIKDDKGTQTMNLHPKNQRLPVQVTNYPIQCTETFLGDRLGIVQPESDQCVSSEEQYLAVHKETQV